MSSKPYEDVVFVAFGNSPEWDLAKLRLLRSLAKNFEHSSNFIVNQNWLFQTSLYRENVSFFRENRRGFGLWVWKPLLIKEAMLRFPKSKYFIYLDMGCDLNINRSSFHRLNDYLKLAQTHQGFAFELNLKEVEWTSKNVLDFFAESKSQQNQISASVLILINNTKTLLFLENWLELMKMDNFHLTIGDQEVSSRKANRHRHDQSILSLLWHKSAMVTIPDETYLNADQKFDSNKPFWVSRNREFLKIDSHLLLRQAARLVRKIFVSLKGYQ
jgi:hypothetical protein